MNNITEKCAFCESDHFCISPQFYRKSNISLFQIHGCEIQDVSTSISIVVKFEEMSEEDDGDESDKHLEARDRRYSCLTWQSH